MISSNAASGLFTSSTGYEDLLPGGRIAQISAPDQPVRRITKRVSFFGKLKHKLEGDLNTTLAWRDSPTAANPPVMQSFDTRYSLSSLGKETISESIESIDDPQPHPETTTIQSLVVKAEELPTATTAANIRDRLDTLGHWSGRGQHVEFQRKEIIPLEEGRSLGRGASADVHEVVCRGITLARKQIYCSRRVKLEDVRRELDILKKLNHKHVVTLVGSYIQSKVLGLLLFPAAVCDLGVFLDEMDEERKNDSGTMGDGLSTILERLEIPNKSLDSATQRLNQVFRCLANAVEYLHNNNIRHKDLKTRNILLDRKDGLLITDFGISRDNTDASTSITAGMERGTYKYCAPEVARLEPRGRAADIYSLGCVFLEIRTVVDGITLTEFDEFRTRNDDHSFQNNQEKVLEWIRKLRQKQFEPSKSPSKKQIFYILDLIERMLAESATQRPLIGAVTANLLLMERLQNSQGGGRWGNSHIGSCCHVDVHTLDKCEELEKGFEKLEKDYIQACVHATDLDALLHEEVSGRRAAEDKAIELTKEANRYREEMDYYRYKYEDGRAQIESLRMQLNAETKAKQEREAELQGMARESQFCQRKIEILKEDLLRLDSELQNRVHLHEVEKKTMLESHKQGLSEIYRAYDGKLLRMREAGESALSKLHVRIAEETATHYAEIQHLAEKYKVSQQQLLSLEAEHKTEREGKAERESDLNALIQQLTTYKQKHG